MPPRIWKGERISRKEAKRVGAKYPIGWRKAQAIQNRRWESKSGEVRTGRIEDLPADHPARES